MCCFYTILLFLGPRVASIVWWIASPIFWELAFDSIIWPILGILLLPWTTLIYVMVFPGGVNGIDWLWIVLAFVVDLSMYGGGAYGNRDRIAYSR